MGKILNRNFFTLPITLTATLAILAIVSGIVLITKQNITSDNKKVQQVNLQKDSSKKAIPSKEKASNSDVVNNIESTPTLTPTIAVYNNSNQQQQSSTLTPQPNPTSVPSQPKNLITLQVSEPDGNSNFSLDYHDGLNPCSILNDAKNADKIRSLTIVYYDSLSSDYIKEMNGYSDGWIFKLNGISEPKGCSNYSLQSNDTVSWKYN